jgi:hypothetical protein
MFTFVMSGGSSNGRPSGAPSGTSNRSPWSLRGTRNGWSRFASSALVIGALVGLAFAASATRAQDGVNIARIEISLDDAIANLPLTLHAPGSEVTVEVGKRLRFRMTAVPMSQSQPRRFPSTDYTPSPRNKHLAIHKIDVPIGSIAFTGVSPHAAGEAPDVIDFRIVDPLQMDPRWATGRILVRVVPPPPPPPPPATDQPGTTPASDRGATLYRDTNWSGRSERFVGDDPDLHNNTVGNDTVSSLRVDPGCEVVLYEDVNYRGRATSFDDHLMSLSGTDVGNDSVSSLRIFCEDEASRRSRDRDDRFDRDRDRDRRDRGAVLFEHPNYQGRSELFSEDDPTLRDNPLGSDAASSIRVDSGCRVVLWSDDNYRGAAMVVEADMPQLGGTQIGSDTVSSIEVDCGGRR